MYVHPLNDATQRKEIQDKWAGLITQYLREAGYHVINIEPTDDPYLMNATFTVGGENDATLSATYWINDRGRVVEHWRN